MISVVMSRMVERRLTFAGLSDVRGGRPPRSELALNSCSERRMTGDREATSVEVGHAPV